MSRMTSTETSYDWDFCKRCKRFGMCTVEPAAICVRCEDAPDVWVSDPEPGGVVCAVCHLPTESEPCPKHQPTTYGAID